jgi:alpha-tubulin suppressor-like RCC1 family protein
MTINDFFGHGESIWMSNGTAVYVMGSNSNGQLGFGDTNDRPLPALHPILRNLVQADSSTVHSLVVTDVGRVWSMGDNTYGQLGTGDYVTYKEPILINAIGNNIISVAVSYGGSSLAVSADGLLWIWGSNMHGQLGLPSGTITVPAPVRATGIRRVTLAKFGGGDLDPVRSFMVAIGTLTTDWVYTTGSGIEGCLATGATADVFGLKQVYDLGSTGTLSLEAGATDVALVDGRNNLICWGTNAYMTCDPAGKSITAPTLSPYFGSGFFLQASLGGTYAMFLTIDGQISVVGSDVRGVGLLCPPSPQPDPFPLKGVIDGAIKVRAGLTNTIVSWISSCNGTNSTDPQVCSGVGWTMGWIELSISNLSRQTLE